MPRSVLLALAVAALAATAVTGAAVPASAARAANPYCNVPVFFGLHGMGEGPPTSTNVGLSPELTGFDEKQNAITHGADYAALVPYTVVGVTDLDLLPSFSGVAYDVATLVSAVQNGEAALDQAFKNYISGCQINQLKIALVGHSMGAWVINKWLHDNPGEWIFIKAVVLYGDPCWVHGADSGLVRTAGIAGVAGLLGCMDASTYPYPAATPVYTPHFKSESWCVGGDPVCGGGYKANLAAQVGASIVCGFTDTACAHNWYRIGEPAESTLQNGAQFMVDEFAAG
jgi:Cutinase